MNSDITHTEKTFNGLLIIKSSQYSGFRKDVFQNVVIKDISLSLPVFHSVWRRLQLSEKKYEL